MITIPLSILFLVAGLFTLLGYLLRIGVEAANARLEADDEAEAQAWRNVWQSEFRVIDADDKMLGMW